MGGDQSPSNEVLDRIWPHQVFRDACLSRSAAASLRCDADGVRGCAGYREARLERDARADRTRARLNAIDVRPELNSEAWEAGTLPPSVERVVQCGETSSLVFDAPI